MIILSRAIHRAPTMSNDIAYYIFLFILYETIYEFEEKKKQLKGRGKENHPPPPPHPKKLPTRKPFNQEREQLVTLHIIHN